MENLNRDIFCERARELFGDVGQIELSQKIGISQGVVSVIKRGDIKATTAETVYKIAKHFGVSADWLMGLSNVKTPDRATNELCDTLGLSEKVIKFLRGEVPTANNIIFSELGKDEEADNVLAFEIDGLRQALNAIGEEHIDFLNIENPERASLVQLLSVFWDNLQIDTAELLNVGGHLYVKQDNRESVVQLGTSGDVWTLDIKEALIASAIQKITAYFVEQKKLFLGDENDDKA